MFRKLTALTLAIMLPLTVAALSTHNHLTRGGAEDTVGESSCSGGQSTTHLCVFCALATSGSHSELGAQPPAIETLCAFEPFTSAETIRLTSPPLGFDSRGPPTLL